MRRFRGRCREPGQPLMDQLPQLRLATAIAVETSITVDAGREVRYGDGHPITSAERLEPVPGRHLQHDGGPCDIDQSACGLKVLSITGRNPG